MKEASMKDSWAHLPVIANIRVKPDVDNKLIKILLTTYSNNNLIGTFPLTQEGIILNSREPQKDLPTYDAIITTEDYGTMESVLGIQPHSAHAHLQDEIKYKQKEQVHKLPKGFVLYYEQHFNARMRLREACKEKRKPGPVYSLLKKLSLVS